MYQIAGILVGGALGALLRFWVANGVYGVLGRQFPYGTLTVNVIGSFLIGYLTFFFMERDMLTSVWSRTLIVGVLGAFTTFSTFSLDTFDLLMQGSLWRAGLNILLNVGLCLLAVWLGVLTGRLI
ncbi:MAG TPA: fluoride efflux transporter CrcB [Candidatus Thiothrix moscowensis]|uniref:fluoride efflux transporter CrcB n=1 Tax=unclassified Thiothrix TaxID=2636184 RepID=UPI0025F7FCDE|nr:MULTISPECIES: fluoride efflux transporter CrcB [unclassified Thiothrix]HRJ53670.1 fluoride efflux transporter CrcB [Candidatus Thiothrix moscowensis]HRJ93752.1 fluoride efflux transporter CrcB [Candidatus Thiothrix moscowensis]